MGERSNDLLNELEESIPQGVPNATRPAPVDDFADLESLLQDSMKDKREREQYQKDREMARKGYAGLSKEEVEYCNSRMRAFELAREWDVAEAIVVFQQFYCPHCDKARTIFSRFMERHQHRFVKSTSRWLTVKSTELEEVLTVLEDRTVAMCLDCMEEFGYEKVSEDTPWLNDVLGIEEPGEDTSPGVKGD
jgi:thiol-disulfide isomerase/thioredoxin